MLIEPSKGDETLRMCKMIWICREHKLDANVLFDTTHLQNIPTSILYKSIAGRYRPVRVADGPITACYRFIKNAYWDGSNIIVLIQLFNRVSAVFK